MEATISSKSLDHLGLVSGMFDELGLVEAIDIALDSAGVQRDVSIGTLFKALVLNGLGFTQRTLYMVSKFFEDKPIELLLGPAIEASQLNDSVLGRALDDIHSFGTTELYTLLTPIICKNLGLAPRFAHMDITSFHLDGNYNSDNPPGTEDRVLFLTQGYSRDHRPDLNQVVLNLIVEQQAGIPLHIEALDGNSSDKTSFRESVGKHVAQLQNTTGFDYLVFDSAGYTKDTLQTHAGSYKWISRMPETLTECQELIGSDVPMRPLAEGYKYYGSTSAYAGVEQRLLLIFSDRAYQREIKTLKKHFLKQSQKESKAFFKLCKQGFSCKRDADKAFSDFKKHCKYIQPVAQGHKIEPKYKGKGRPKNRDTPTYCAHYIRGTVSVSLQTYTKLQKYKGRFVIATNELNTGQLTDIELFKGYKGQSKVEKGFRFLKDPQFVATGFFVKKAERVDALLFIMTLCLTVYAALEFRIRQQLGCTDETLPNQVGKEVKNPTTRWVFALFTGIHVLYGTPKPLILNLKQLHTKVIQLLGEKHYLSYYPPPI